MRQRPDSSYRHVLRTTLKWLYFWIMGFWMMSDSTQMACCPSLTTEAS